METWKDIKGYEGKYQVSDKGRVKSLLFINNITKKKREKILSCIDNGNGYLYISLSKNGKRENHYVHRLVADAFLKRKKHHTVVNHKDYNRKNNDVNNLEWCTTLENIRHSIPNMHNEKAHSKTTNTGEKYITLYYDGYYKVRCPKAKERRFKTFEEALAYKKAVYYETA